ncbi:ABC transporter substrate-binding protein [Pelagibacterium sp. 26DY04]|uniref:ABC transporter substrate-binding protein n=1 Tax=Pelagibacterium sp. 26DY04 TaxID=2967130 RepID=UPI002815A418|nr:ABC transporter substrate-binding protein [Pelagibacterium sp. 26DY04]WMT88379.1 ABC transporter substrate-binding protein [Pelagibacterium sp. 26DY04]
MHRRNLLAAALASLALPAIGQTIPDTVDEPVTITFYNYNLAMAGNGADATRRLIDQFMAENPNITVDAIPVGAAESTTTVQADLAAGQPVDLVQMGFSTLSYAVDNYGAVALEDIIPQDELDGHFEGMVPNGLDLGRLNDKTYGLAYTFSTPVLFYNANLFREAGLDPDQPPETWDEIRETALAIEDATGKEGFAAGIFGPSAADWLFQGVVRSNGGEVISRDRTTLTFAEPPAVEAVQMLRDLYDAGAFDPMDITAALEGMSSGNIGMYLQTSAIQGALVSGAEGNFELRASTMPSFGDKPVRPNNSGSALVILSQDPLKQRAAWELMKFLTSEEGYTVITSEIGYLPLRPAIVDDPRYLKDWVEEHPLVQPNLDQLAILEPWESMPGPNYLQIVSIMMDAAEMAVYGGVDVEATLRDAQANAQALMP